jgi:hypothetical protein
MYEFGRGDVGGNVASQLFKLVFSCCCCISGRNFDVFVWDVCIITSKLEHTSGLFFLFLFFSIQWSPTTSVHSFLVVDAEAQFNGCRSLDCESSVIRKLSSNSPLESSKIEVNGNKGVIIVGVIAGCVISPAVVFVQPLGFFEVSFRDVLLPPT